MKTKTKSTVARRRVKRRQDRVSHKKLRTLRSRKYASKTARKVMRGGLFNAINKQIKVIARQIPVENAFTLSYRKSFTNDNTVLLELVIDISKYKHSISLILDTLLSYLFGIKYKSGLTTIFDDETRNIGIKNNKELLSYTAGKEFGSGPSYNYTKSAGIYYDLDPREGKTVSDLARAREWGKLSDKEISTGKINSEIEKMEKTNVSKVSFSISISNDENHNITIKDLKKSTIDYSPAKVVLVWKEGGRYFGTRVVEFYELSHDVDTKIESPEGTQKNITIESIITKLSDISEINATKDVEEEEAAAAAAEAVREAAREVARKEEEKKNAEERDRWRIEAENKFDTTFISTKEQYKETIHKISEFASWLIVWKTQNRDVDDSVNLEEVYEGRKKMNDAFESNYTEEQRKEITDSLKLFRQTYQSQTSENKKIFLNYFNTKVDSSVLRYRFYVYLQLSDDIIKIYSEEEEKTSENEELDALWRQVVKHKDPQHRDG